MFYTYDPISGKYVKDVPVNIEEFLTPSALAILYMDDGSVKDAARSKAMRISTESFSKAGVERLQLALIRLYGIDCSLTPKYSGFVPGTTEKKIVGYLLYIKTQSAPKFADLIRDRRRKAASRGLRPLYVLDSMKYKLAC